MIMNNICENCWHQFVCDKRKTLLKFDNTSKGYVDVDIEIKHCKDFVAPDLVEQNDE